MGGFRREGSGRGRTQGVESGYGKGVEYRSGEESWRQGPERLDPWGVKVGEWTDSGDKRVSAGDDRGRGGRVRPTGCGGPNDTRLD